MDKHRILCFGDSLTWGYDPDTGNRFSEDERWTGVLSHILGDGYIIIEEGQNGRTICTEDPAEGEKCGIKYLIPCMESQRPTDIMIIMLGTNDLKRKFAYSAMDIAGEMQIFLEKALGFNRFKCEDRIKFILISPPHVGEQINQSYFGDSFGYDNAVKVSKELASWYEKLADMYGCSFIDAAKYVTVSSADSIHMDSANHKILADVIAKKIMSIM